MPHDYDMLCKEMEVQDMVYGIQQLQEEAREMREKLTSLQRQVVRDEKLVWVLVVVGVLKQLLF